MEEVEPPKTLPEAQASGLTIEEYNGAVGRLHLKASAVADVYFDPDGMSYNVPNGARFTPEQRAEIIGMLTVKVRGY